MKIMLNGKPIIGEGTADEPPPAAHVLRRLIDARVIKVRTEPLMLTVELEDRCGNTIELRTFNEVTQRTDGMTEVELVAEVRT